MSTTTPPPDDLTLVPIEGIQTKYLGRELQICDTLEECKETFRHPSNYDGIERVPCAELWQSLDTANQIKTNLDQDKKT